MIATDVAQQLDEALAGCPLPGAAVGLWAGGEEHYVVRGVASTSVPVPVDEDTLFQIGSTTKTYTALAVLRLVEAGLLGLDEPVRTYVPELSMADEQALRGLTLRHLLTHTGGHDGDLFEDFGGGDDCLARLAANLHRVSQLAPLGTFSYSNVGFSLAGRAVEAVTGMTFERAIEALVLRPLGHTQTCLRPEDAITRRVALGHGADGTVTRPWALPRTAGPAGGIASSVREQIDYARFHLGDGRAGTGERLLSSAALIGMRAPHATAGGGRAAHVGLSWLLQPTPGVIAHGGSTNGQESAFVIVPDKDFAITVLTNSATGAHVHRHVVKWALRNVAGVQGPVRREAPQPASDLEPYVGRFVAALEHLVVEREGPALFLSYEPTETSRAWFPSSLASGRMPLSVHADDSVLVGAGAMQGARGEFLRDDHGRVRRLRMLGRVHARDA